MVSDASKRKLATLNSLNWCPRPDGSIAILRGDGAWVQPFFLGGDQRRVEESLGVKWPGFSKRDTPDIVAAFLSPSHPFRLELEYILGMRFIPLKTMFAPGAVGLDWESGDD